MDPLIGTSLSTISLIILVTVAAIWDCVQRRIPNKLVIIGLVMGVGLALILGGLLGMAESVAGAGVGMLLLLWPFSKGWLGGGDVKLMMVCGSFLGPKDIVLVILVSTAFNGLLSLGWLMLSRRGIQVRGVPFAVAVAFAVFAVVVGVVPVDSIWA